MAEAIVSIVVERLSDLLIEEVETLDDASPQIQEVVTNLRWMRSFLPEADSRLKEHNIGILVADVRELVYNAEHVVESFLLKASGTERRRREGGIKNMTKRSVSLFKEYAYHRKFSREMKDVQKRIADLSRSFRLYNIRSTLEKHPYSSSSTYERPDKLKRFYSYAVVEPEIFVGFEGDVERLVGYLVNEISDVRYQVISICGMGGLGKTTLAQKIYNHSTTKTYFEGLAWVSISQKWQAEQVLQRILISLAPEKRNEILTQTLGKLVENMLEIQERKKCLIVLDDIWSNDAWDSLKAAFATGTKLLLTSRNISVAEHVNPNCYIYQPQHLDEEQSWELLRLKALPYGDFLHAGDVKKMEELGREMLGKCGGLPLAIVVLGGILVTKPSLIEWEKVYEDSKSSLKSGKGLGEDQQKEVFDILSWSYNDLPPQLKPCFLYLSRFEEDQEIETETLYQLWIAEGMVLSSDKREGETMMEVADSYLGELMHKCMVQVKFEESEESSIRKFKYCRLHDVMRDLALSQAKEEDFVKVVDLTKENYYHLDPSIDLMSSNSRQLAVYFENDIYTGFKDIIFFLNKATQQRLRSVLLFSKSRWRNLPPLVVSHIANFRLLRVFALENVKIDENSASGHLFCINLGRVLGSLVYLRYLSVRDSDMSFFPSIQKLELLQTLKLGIGGKMSFPPAFAKNILGNLGRLRHMSLPLWVGKLWRDRKLGFDGLSKLETLENFNPCWCEVKDLHILTNLRILTVKVRKSNDDLKEMMEYLPAVASLSSSCLCYFSLSIVECDLQLQNGADILRKLLFDPSLNINQLSIVGAISDLVPLFEKQQRLHNHIIDLSLSNVTTLRLSGSLLENDPMPVLEKLPRLRILDLYEKTFEIKEIVCSATGFTQLKTLVLERIVKLEKWRVEQGSMRNLSYLTISNCLNLELPEGLRFLKSLQELTLINYPLLEADHYKVAHVPSIILNDNREWFY